MSDTSTKSAADLVSEARREIRNLAVEQFAAEISQPGVVLLDVREPHELAAEGTIAGAIPAPRGMLEFYADAATPYHIEALRPDVPIAVYCKSGGRSALAAATLAAMGYRDVAHLDGGFAAWNQAGMPITRD